MKETKFLTDRMLNLGSCPTATVHYCTKVTNVKSQLIKKPMTFHFYNMYLQTQRRLAGRVQIQESISLQ